MLTAERRKQLDSIVMDLSKKNAPQQDVQIIVNDFKSKFENENSTSTTPSELPQTQKPFEDLSVSEKMFSSRNETSEKLRASGHNILAGTIDVLNAPTNLYKGIAKGALSTVTSIGQLALKGAKALAPDSIDPILQGGIDYGEELKNTTLAAEGGMQTIGKVGEQIGEFFIPVGLTAKAVKIAAAGIMGSKIATQAGKTGNLAAKAMSLLSRSGILAGEAAGITALQTGGDREQMKFNAAIAGAIPVVGVIVKPIAKAILKPLGEKIQNVLIKPSGRDLADGFKIENITKYNLGGSFEDMVKNTNNRIVELSNQLKKAIGGSNAKINILSTIDDAEREIAKNSPGTFGVNTKIGTAFNHWRDELKVITEDGVVDIADAQMMKRSVGKAGAWSFGKFDPDSSAMERVSNSIYDKIKVAIEKASGVDIKGINRQLSELIPIENAIMRRLPVHERNAILGLSDIITAVPALIHPANAWLFVLNKLSKSGKFANTLISTSKEKDVPYGPIKTSIFGPKAGTILSEGEQKAANKVKTILDSKPGLSIEDVSDGKASNIKRNITGEKLYLVNRSTGRDIPNKELGFSNGYTDNYTENIYSGSPIKSNLTEKHFEGDANTARDYYAHTRTEDIPTEQARAIIEIQSDLFSQNRNSKLFQSEKKKWLENVIKKEIETARESGIQKIDFPKGRTAAKINHENERAFYLNDSKIEANRNNTKTGDYIDDTHGLSGLVIKNLGDGKYKISNYLWNDTIKELDETIDIYKKRILKDPDKFNQKALKKAIKEKQLVLTYPSIRPTKGPLIYYNPKGLEVVDLSKSGEEVMQSSHAYKFYEEKIASQLRSMGYKYETIKDPFGLEWRRININTSPQLGKEAPKIDSKKFNKFDMEQIKKPTPTILSKPYKNSGPLTTKILNKLEGRSEVSRQFISDLTNSGDLKQQERDLIREVLGRQKGDKINVTSFAEDVKNELLPLKIAEGNKFEKSGGGRPVSRYESISLPNETRGNVANYSEHIYESPIKTSAGATHFGSSTDNYFGHTRIEDMGTNKESLWFTRGNEVIDTSIKGGKLIKKFKTKEEAEAFIRSQGKTRRIIEVQSDLYQKGNLDRETSQAKSILKNDGLGGITSNDNDTRKFIKNEAQKRINEVKKLEQYNNPTAHFRMAREEIAQAAKDGKTKIQFPTGETAMKIEGLGESRNRWFINIERENRSAREWNNAMNLKPEKLKVGIEIKDDSYAADHTSWIITDVLGDGKFKAIQKSTAESFGGFSKLSEIQLSNLNKDVAESFDISGKIDTNNPIYKFYEKDLGKYLRSKYNAQTITDDKGVQWNQIDIKPDMNKPVEAFGKAPIKTLVSGAGIGLAGAVGAKGIQTLASKLPSKKETIENEGYKKDSTKETVIGKAQPKIDFKKAVAIIEQSGNIEGDWMQFETSTIKDLQTRYGLDKNITLDKIKKDPNLYNKVVNVYKIKLEKENGLKTDYDKALWLWRPSWFKKYKGNIENIPGNETIYINGQNMKVKDVMIIRKKELDKYFNK